MTRDTITPIWSGETRLGQYLVLVAEGWGPNPRLAVWDRDQGTAAPLWSGHAADFEAVVVHGETVISGWGGASLLAAARAVSDFVADVWHPAQHLHDSGWLISEDGMSARWGTWELAREGSTVRVLDHIGQRQVAIPRAVLAHLARDRMVEP